VKIRMTGDLEILKLNSKGFNDVEISACTNYTEAVDE
jgi:hypothetical protein